MEWIVRMENGLKIGDNGKYEGMRENLCDKRGFIFLFNII